ncbi:MULTISPECIES: site-2 protease family protein [Clostridium]|uniref:site-2 protease family protein n=1 Tax=Clostridium TaxID=1485 RepID=UPI0009998652|nr:MULTISPECIES: site-2 protease family protein [Clostridium]
MFLTNTILFTLLIIPGILAGLTFHEYAHALVADKLGDKTPRFQGRLTLNPIAHIDPIGFLALLIFQFGWAKPVQVNPSAFKKYYKDDLKVSLAGPLANVVVAFISALLAVLFEKLVLKMSLNMPVLAIIYTILKLSVYINCRLAVLNLIPLPGFDGFHILRDLFPKVFYNFAEKVYNYQVIIMIIFFVTPISSILVGVPASIIEKFIYTVVGVI